MLLIGSVTLKRLFALRSFPCSLFSQFYSLSRGHISLIRTLLLLENAINPASAEAPQPGGFPLAFNSKQSINKCECQTA